MQPPVKECLAHASGRDYGLALGVEVRLDVEMKLVVEKIFVSGKDAYREYCQELHYRIKNHKVKVLVRAATSDYREEIVVSVQNVDVGLEHCQCLECRKEKVLEDSHSWVFVDLMGAWG